MKQYIKSVFVSLAALSTSAMASPVLVSAPVEKIFVPSGFDDNDKVELAVHGHFPNSCYKIGPVSATVDEASKEIRVTAEAYYYSGAVCMQMMIPFLKSIDLPAFVRAGNYTVRMVDRVSGPEAQMKVAKSMRSEPDDYLYAGVQSAYIETTDAGQELVLKGAHPHMFEGCIKFVDVKTYRSPQDVLVVQPITRIASDEECQGTDMFRFEHRTVISEPVPTGEYLLHVRALDGNAVNQLMMIER